MSREDHERLGTAEPVAGAAQQERHAGDQRPPRETMEQGRELRSQHLGGEQMPPQMGDPQARHPQAIDRPPPHGQSPADGMEQLAALFPPQVAADFRHRWDQVQIGFVDDPRQAVQRADELVAHVMKSLAGTFAEQRAQLEASLGRDGQANTEDLRVALRGYRSFFQRLLSL